MFSNAAARMSRSDPAAEVDAAAETNNLATTPRLRSRWPADRRGQRARHARQVRRSGARPLRGGPDPSRRRSLVADWREAVDAARAEAEGYGSWLNIPSNLPQAAAVCAIARECRVRDLAVGRLIMALCPGLTDTDASRAWFADMSGAQASATAASWPVELALASSFDPGFYGELVQFGRILPWDTGVPVPRTVAA